MSGTIVSLTPNLLLNAKYLAQPLEAVEQELNSGTIRLRNSSNQAAYFFDRDGTINFNGDGYNFHYPTMQIIPGAFAVMAEKKRQGYLVFILTNQSGIARGYFSAEQFIENMQLLAEDFFRQTGEEIDAILYAPALDKSDPYRKPNLGSLALIQQFFNLDLANSTMVGDSQVDADFAQNAGMHFVQVDEQTNSIAKLLAEHTQA